MTSIITATGLWTPQESVSNEELVESYNAYADLWNAEHADEIAAGKVEPVPHSSAAFIEKASGIKSRYVMDKAALLNPEIMRPHIPARSNDALSVTAEIAVNAARDALKNAGRKPSDVDAVIIACSNIQRAYPAISIEVQNALGTSGFAFDMNVACSSATFGIETARGFIASGQAKSVLVINPEICTGHMNYKNRDSHFIFGDVATALLVEDESAIISESSEAGWDILGSKLITTYSNNIRNNFGFLNRCEELPSEEAKRVKPRLSDKLFMQNGRSVFKEVVPMVASLISDELEAMDIAPQNVKRMWLHQANLSMNTLIAKKVMGKDVDMVQSPVVLDEYANTSSAGSIIAFHKHSDDFKSGELGLICSFGAGYSAGLIVVRKR